MLPFMVNKDVYITLQKGRIRWWKCLYREMSVHGTLHWLNSVHTHIINLIICGRQSSTWF